MYITQWLYFCNETINLDRHKNIFVIAIFPITTNVRNWSNLVSLAKQIFKEISTVINNNYIMSGMYKLF